MRALMRIGIVAAAAATLAVPSASLAQAGGDGSPQSAGGGSKLGKERTDVAAIFTPDLTR